MNHYLSENQPWYAVRCLFRDDSEGIYEERTILVRADSHSKAIELAELDAQEYAQTLGMEFQGYSDTFHIFDEMIENGTEIFSLMRKISLDRDAYIDRYLDSGSERRRTQK